MDETKRLRRFKNQESSQAIKTPKKKLQHQMLRRRKTFCSKKNAVTDKDNTLRTTLKYISLFEDTSTWIPVVCETDEEIKQAIQDDCILVCQANGKTFFKKPA